jgi:hypothetical protein
MSELKSKHRILSDSDLDFLVETASPHVSDKANLKRIIREDEDFRNTYLADEKVFRRLMDEDDVLLKISAAMFFEILLRKAARDLAQRSYTIEKTTTMRIPVFDTTELVALLNQESILGYLAHMLSSFTRINSYMVSVRIGPGSWKKIRFNDLDIHSLKSFCEAVETEYKFAYYKRIADICLFILGIFPNYADRNYRYPLSGTVRPKLPGIVRVCPEEYAEEGQKFYKLAAEHHSAIALELSEIFWSLHQNFQKAIKPLNFIAEYYLQYKRQDVFA